VAACARTSKELFVFIAGEESRRLRRNATVQEAVGEFKRRHSGCRRPGPRLKNAGYIEFDPPKPLMSNNERRAKSRQRPGLAHA
jgi:hypothetical protein